MKRLIQKFFQQSFDDSNDHRREMSLDMATAILMIEVSRADFNQDESERMHIRQLLSEHLSIDDAQLEEMLESAHEEADRLVSLQHITRLMNEKMDQQGKVRVVELMWKVAYADGEKHHYEEHLLRQVADLLYVSHADFIQARHQAEESA